MNWGGACCWSKNGCIANDQNCISTKIISSGSSPSLNGCWHQSKWADTAMASGDGFEVDGCIWRMYFKEISKEMHPVWISSILSIRLLGSEENSNIRHDSELGFNPEGLNVHFHYSIWSWWFHPNWVLVVKLDRLPKHRGPQHLINNVNKHQPLSPYRVQIANLNVLIVDGREYPEAEWSNLRKEHDILHIQEVYTKTESNYLMFPALSIYTSPHMWPCSNQFR